MKKTAGQTAVERLREFTEALESGDDLPEKFSFRKLELDLCPHEYSPELVKETRKLLRLSQAMFAKFLGVEVTTVQKWERGAKTPQDIACRFMDEFRQNPKFWRRRIKKSARVVGHKPREVAIE
jgi:putative transcriptional regulator